MMNKLKELGNTYFWVIVAAWLIGICIVIYLFSAWQEGATNRTVTSQTTQANTAVKQAQNAANVAADSDIERRAEDAVREKTIAPKLDTARKTSQNSKVQLEKAQRKLENEKLRYENLQRDIAANCVELQRLYPDTKFAYCQP